jgi:hypothetical protein
MFLGLPALARARHLQMINAFLQADRRPHFLRLYGRDALPHNKPACNAIFRDLGLFPHMTISENVAYGLKVRGVDLATRRKCMAEMLGIVGRDGYERRRIHRLSGGQRQRVAVCPSAGAQSCCSSARRAVDGGRSAVVPAAARRDQFICRRLGATIVGVLRPGGSGSRTQMNGAISDRSRSSPLTLSSSKL